MKNKINGVGKGGIICLFISSAIMICMGLVFLILGTSIFYIPMASAILTGAAIGAMILPILIIVFGAMAISKGKNGFKITCGVLALVSVIFSWYMVIPAILGLVGGILTLCGKVEDYGDRTPTIPQIN